MIAYVFWHHVGAAVDHAAHEAALRELHERLRATPSEGFLESATFRVRGLPWIAEGSEAYEDWYLLRDSAALDPLNESAVAGDRRAPHDAAARLASAGAGGLYRLRAGNPSFEARSVTWFGKPSGMTYAALDALLAPSLAGDAALWRRQ
ncbi:MAG: hypothetical protein ACREM2_12535, partial [Vulcanimicrobiaceae bacterium]